MIGNINSFHSFSTNDGPGIRAVVFMQGCPLRCKCCHNPETWDLKVKEECNSIDLFNMINSSKSYYLKGGVTFSGGEPLLQASFIHEVVKMLKNEKLHVAIDTSGCIINEQVIELLKDIDLVLLDIKCNSEEVYYDFAKGSLKTSLEFLAILEELNKPVWIRRVIIKDYNDSDEDLRRFKELLAPYKCIKQVDFLGFKKFFISKYEAMKIHFPLESALEPSDLEMNEIKAKFNELKIDK